MPIYSACGSSYLIIPYEIYHVHVHLNFTIFMCRYNIVVDVNEMGIKHTYRFLLGQRFLRQAYTQLCWRRSLSICCVKMDWAKRHGGMLAFGGTKLLQEPNLCLQFSWNLSFFSWCYKLWQVMLDENKCMWYVDLMPCWKETWFLWCYYFCAGIFVWINGWKKWDELVG